MTITALKQTSPEHITVSLEDGSTIDSTLGVITEMLLYSGRDLDEEALEKLRSLSLRALTLERAVSLLSYRQMSGREMRSKLVQKGVDPETAEAVVERMQELRLLDDEAYAAAVVRHYAGKGYGAQRLRMELSRRGIDRELWDAALAEAPEPDDRIDSILRAKLKDPEDRDQVRKVTAALYRRGFSWDEIRSALNRFEA